MRIGLVVTALMAGIACVNENNLSDVCGVPGRGFDIEEASTLQDAQGYTGMHDAVVLAFDDSEVPEGATWRVRSVEILPMIGARSFDNFRDGQRVSVEIWDADNPTGPPYKVTQTFLKDELEWEDTRLSSPDSATEFDQRRAWWRFGFENHIPTTGMMGPDYLVGVVWEDEAQPTLGYSNFNNSCSLNWTDYADGRGFVRNQGFLSDAECSWPMLRVNLEVLQEVVGCEGQTYAIE